ncbi:MAG: hypothetical protein HYS13_21440 [Planctomycetia bacterium]|nr:hypothetical protein [Planctomycetia bacterium]
MKQAILIAAAIVAPALWGWLTFWLARRLLPPKPESAATGDQQTVASAVAATFPDYQI